MRHTIRDMLPEIGEIADPDLREKVVDVWEDAMLTGGWTREEIEAIPFTLLAGDTNIRFVEHVRTCAKLSMVVADTLQAAYQDRYRICRDHLAAGALLADVGKLIEYVKGPDGAPSKGSRGEMLRHPFSGVGLCWKHGLPDPVMHIVATHSREGDHVRRSNESIVFHHADFIDFELAQNQ